jgi:Zn-dependent protease
VSQYGPGATSYSYSWAPTQPERGRLSTSPREVLHIGVAFVVLTLDFVLILYVGGLFSADPFAVFGSQYLAVALVAAGIASTAFVCHELAHKISAQRQGYWAEFRWSPLGLVFSLITAYIGFLFALPGATVVGGMADARQWGRTSLAGPASNMSFAAVFYVAAVVTWYAGSVFWFWLLIIAFFNVYFAAFNLIPFGPLDGAKVLRWNSGIWGVAFAIAAIGAAVCAIGLYVTGRPIL